MTPGKKSVITALGILRADHDTPQSTEVVTFFVKRESLSRYSSLVDESHGVIIVSLTIPCLIRKFYRILLHKVQ
jgi:hypothetical protein